MFGLGKVIGGVARAAVGVAITPVAAIADIATVGGLATNKREPYTVTAVKGVLDNLEDAVKPERR